MGANLAFAGLLSAAVFLLVLGQRRGGIAAAVAAVTMTAPVAYARARPSAAGLSLAAAAALNGLFFDHVVRCGAALPAAFYVAFVSGSARRRRGSLGMAGGVVSIVLQCVFDPRLGVPVIAVMVPLTGMFFGAGLYIRSRAARVATLRSFTKQLQEDRDQIAYLAVAADRQELTNRLNHTLQERIAMISVATAMSGTSADRFARIETLGRQTLDVMRELVGSLGDTPLKPEPGLADLADVCARATTAAVRLAVSGSMRPLPASIELSACRIVEQLLRLLTDDPATRVQVRVDVAPVGLDIAVSGAPSGEVDLRHVQALACARAALHGGSVDISDGFGQRRARVWLPLISAHG